MQTSPLPLGYRAEIARLTAACEAEIFKKPDKTPPTLVAMLNEAIPYYKRKGRKELAHATGYVKKLRAGLAGKRADEITKDHVNDYAEARHGGRRVRRRASRAS